jgi:hypothetical protein
MIWKVGKDNSTHPHHTTRFLPYCHETHYNNTESVAIGRCCCHYFEIWLQYVDNIATNILCCCNLDFRCIKYVLLPPFEIWLQYVDTITTTILRGDNIEFHCNS